MPPDQAPSPALRFQFRLRTLFIATAGAGLLAFCFSRPVNPLERLFALAFWDETSYSPDYSESGWRRVRQGMTKAQVCELLGEPVTRIPRMVCEVWEYTTWRRFNRWFHKREISFSKGVVVHKDGEFCFHY